MATSTNGKFLYEADTKVISVFAIDPATGAISASGAPVPVADETLILSFY
jgi:hypothetical protein